MYTGWRVTWYKFHELSKGKIIWPVRAGRAFALPALTGGTRVFYCPSTSRLLIAASRVYGRETLSLFDRSTSKQYELTFIGGIIKALRITD